MSNLELHNFVEDYVCQDNDDIQWKTASRYEFFKLRSDPKKDKKEGNYFYHQEVFLRYVRQYNKIFNIQGTGTGKSGSIINVAEYYKNNAEGIKRVYVLQPGPPTVKDFKSQIRKLSQQKEYNNLKIRSALTERSRKNNINRIINEWYSVETYRQFAKRNAGDEIIKEEFSDCIIFMDEAHKLRNLDDNDGGTLTSSELDNIYQFLWRVTHLAERSKIIISTATPMINETKEFALLLNLLLPMNFQLPINISNTFYDRTTLSQLEPYLRGKITFIKFLESKIIVNNMGTILNDYNHNILMPKNVNYKGEALIPIKKDIVDNNIVTLQEVKEKKQPLVEAVEKKFASQAKVFMLPMTNIQLETYNKTIKDTGAFFINQRYASIFVFPNGQYGNKGFKNYIDKDEYGNYTFKDSIVYRNENREIVRFPSLKKYFQTDSEENIEKSLLNLGNMSSKFKFFIEKELKASRQEKPGNSFCYIEFVEGSGAEVLGLLLKTFGFEEFTTTVDPFNIRTGKLDGISKGKRFAFLTGKSNNIETTLKLFNSRENMHGEYIQMIIASKLARDGVNIFNVLRGYIMTPSWHESGMYQALSRFIRADSHDYLYDLYDKKIKIEIYRLAATRENELELVKKGNYDKLCIDIKNYLISEEKNIKNKRIIRFMKQVAFDAYLNYDRNTIKEVESFTDESDYGERFFKIWKARGAPNNKIRTGIARNQGPNMSEIVSNTYNLLYAQNNICQIKEKIITILQKNFYMSVDNIKRELEKDKIEYSDYIIFQAIYELVYNNETIANYQNTLLYKIFNKGDIIFIKRENLKHSNRLSTENDIYFIEPLPMITKKLPGEEEEIKYEKMKAYLMDKSKAEIRDYYILRQYYTLFKRLLEESLVALKNDNLNSLFRNILDLMSNYYMVVDKPRAYLEAGEKALVEMPKGQGRKRAANSDAGLKKLNFAKIKDERSREKIYVHFYKESEKTAFAISSILESSNRVIRILTDNTFEDASLVETYVYNYLFTQEYNKILQKYKQSKYYGTYILRGGENEEFIADKKKNFFRIIDNSNERNKGIMCLFNSTANNIKILKYLDTEKKYDDLTKGRPRKNEICAAILNLFREKDLLFESF